MRKEKGAETMEESPENPEEKASEEPDEPEEEGTAEEPSTQVEEPKAPKLSDEMKVVIIMKSDAIMLGVQSPDCDPVYETMKGDLTAALKKVPALVKKAKKQWETSPQYPKANLPEPPPRPAPVSSQTAPTSKPQAQPKFF